MGLSSPTRTSGTQGVHLLQGRGRDERENRELFREGVEGLDTKIRPSVPKKTLAPTKALERGSSARNVTPGSAPTGLGNEVSPQDHGAAQWLVVTGTPPPSGPAGKILELVPSASCPHPVSTRARGQSHRIPGLSDLPSYVFPFLTVPLSPLLSVPCWVCVCAGGRGGVLREQPSWGLGLQRPSWECEPDGPAVPATWAQASAQAPRIREAPSPSLSSSSVSTPHPNPQGCGPLSGSWRSSPEAISWMRHQEPSPWSLASWALAEWIEQGHLSGSVS